MFINKNKLFFIMVTCIISGLILVSLPQDASAFSATITTSSDIKVNASPSGDGTSIHEESINVVSDCRSGYNLSIATPEGSNLYADGNGSTTAVFTAVDGTSALNSTNNTNKWGYTLATNPTSSTVFSPLSATLTILKTSSQTASSTTDINDTFSINYGVKVNNTVTPGSYKMANNGSIVYYLTMDTTCTQYTVEFNPNGGTITSGETNPTQGIQTGEPTKLTSADSLKAPTTSSYTDADNNTITGEEGKLWAFWGWNTQVDGTGDWYKDRESVTNLQQAGSTITLYAQWKQATLADMTTSTPSGTEKVIDHNEMQDIRPEICYNSPITTAENAPAATLLDARGKVITGETPESPESYTVSKLADNNCWMTKNLNLGRTGTGGPNGNGTITLTSDDTDLAENTTFTLPVSTTTSSTTTTAARIRVTNTSGNNKNGTYYSWPAAIASTATYTTANVIVTSSVCPKNWDLPTNDQYTNLQTKAAYTSSNTTTSAPSSFLTNGGFTNGATFYQTSYSHFWTSRTAGTYAYGSRVNASSISVSSSNGTTYGGNKYYEKNIRCIASNGTVTINYDGNGTTEHPVTGTTASQENVEINSVNTQANGFSRTGWVFNGWNTAVDGTGTAIAASTAISTLNPTPGSTITLYAQWLPQYNITYVDNCKSWAASDTNCTDSKSATTSEQKVNLTNNPSTGTETTTLGAYNKFTMTGWKIKGWSTVADNSDNSNPEYGVGTNYTVPSGSGVGDGITLYAHWIPVYSIQYDGNGADNPNGMGTTDASTGVKSVKQTNIGEGDPVTLLASNFKKAGNGFAGWSTDPDAWTHFIDNDNTNDPVIYGPMETISAPAYPTNGTNITTLYAVWVPAEKDGSNNPVYMQEWDDPTDIADGCAALTSTTFNSTTGVITANNNGIIALTDKRDDEVYTIAKLADDNCWMIENLRLEHEGTVGNNKNDSSVTNESLSQGYGGTAGIYGNFVGLADSESDDLFKYSTTANTIYKSDGSGSVFDPTNSTLEDIGISDGPGYRFPRYNNDNVLNLIDGTTYIQDYIDVSRPVTSGTFQKTNLYSYGNYYNWAAANADTNYYVPSTSNIAEATSTSICPFNWHLPSSDGAAKEYTILSQSYGGDGGNQNGIVSGGDIMSSHFRSFPNNFLYSGLLSSAATSSLGRSEEGGYWSRSLYNTMNGSYYLSLDSTSLYTHNVEIATHGLSVRCLISP